jgi:hypothetical protein
MWRALFLLFLPAALAFDVALPPRPSDALNGTAFANSVTNLDLAAREREVLHQVDLGNVPNFWRHFVKVTSRGFDWWVAPDYFAIGSDEDFFLCPITPMTAKQIGAKIDCVLPTPALVDDIYAAAKIHLTPTPIPPTPEMTTVAIFLKHNEIVRQQRAEFPEPLGALVAGHKKDVVVSEVPGKVAIYGWHQPDAKAIQPLYLGHTEKWVDYSHGARFVHRSNELHFDPNIRVVVDEPEKWAANLPTRLILYALPNGNSIEETIGRQPRNTNEWRYGIQHIGAQTRWLREHVRDANLVVAYLECAEKAWPAWRRAHDLNNEKIPAIVERLRNLYAAAAPPKIVLTGHSGGGSFTFGYINALDEIPDSIERIAFLDSNYAYDNQSEKFAKWLRASDYHYLCVLAYHDDIALLNGKTFVSENGGTWGRSHAMLKDLSAEFIFETHNDPDWQRANALNGRIQFLLKENPTKAILHTRQVELNGFIHAMLTGTPLENKGYQYFGPRAYEEFISHSNQ